MEVLNVHGRDLDGGPMEIGALIRPGIVRSVMLMQHQQETLQEVVMLANAPVTTILPVMDMARAREFYENKLALTPVGMRPDGKFVYSCGGGAVIALFPREGGTKADHTAISFQVENIEAAIRELKAAGVVFEDYDLPELKTVDHVCVLGAEKAAWFKDPEGNCLCIHEDIA